MTMIPRLVDVVLFPGAGVAIFSSLIHDLSKISEWRGFREMKLNAIKPSIKQILSLIQKVIL